MLREYIRIDARRDKISIKELAERIGVSYVTLYNLLKGRKIKNSTIRKIAKYYDMPIERVVYLNDNKQP